MSAKRETRPLQTLFGYVLALLLTVSLTAACGLALINKLLTDQALHERVALDPRVLDAQTERVEGTVRALAETYHFAPETVLGMAARKSLEAYGREMVAWWMGLTREHAETEAPFPDTAAMEEAVREDALFRESTEDYMRRSVARDDIAYPIGLAMQQAVMPLRVLLLSLAVPKVKERVDVPRLMSLMSTAPTAALALAAVFMALLLLTQGRRRWLFASAGFMASFILLAAVTAMVATADWPGAMAAYSPLLSLQLSVLLGVLAPPVLLTEGVILLAAIMLLLPLLRVRGKAYHSRHERKRA